MKLSSPLRPPPTPQAAVAAGTRRMIRHPNPNPNPNPNSNPNPNPNPNPNLNRGYKTHNQALRIHVYVVYAL